MRKILFLSCLVVLIFGVIFAIHLHEKPQPELVSEFEFALVPVDNITNLIIWHKIPENFEMGIKLQFADENIDIQAKNLSSNKVYLYQINKKVSAKTLFSLFSMMHIAQKGLPMEAHFGI